MLSALTIGDKVDIKDLNPVKEGERKKIYLSQVVEVINSTTVKILIPSLGTKLIPLTKGQRYVCTYYTKKGLLEGDFVVGDRVKEGNLPMIILEIRTPLKKVQRREFYRYECTLPMKWRIAERDEKIPRDELKKLEWQDGVILDLSGGGMRFVTPTAIPRDSFAQIHLILTIKETYREFYLYGDIIFSKAQQNNVRLHECRAQFFNMTAADQDAIISYIFEEERKRRSSS